MNLNEAFHPLEQLAGRLIDVAPRLLFCVLILIVGLIASSIAGRIVRFLVRKSGLEALSEKFGVAKVLYAVGVKRGLARLLGRIVWFGGLLITLSASAEALGLPGMAQVSAAIVSILPRLVVATAIAAIGLVVADLLRNVVRQAGKKEDDLEAPEFAAQLVYYAVVVVTLTIALEQAGIETGLINSIVQIGVGGAVLSLAVAFAFGSRDAFKNFVARHYMQRLLRPGDRIDVSGAEGEVVRYGPVSVVIRKDDGECVIPCSLLLSSLVGLQRADKQSSR